jgi:hypothetical protein
MSVIKFPSPLVSTLEISEAIDWPHSELMKDAHATADEPQMPADWFRLVHYRDECGSAQPAYNMTCSRAMIVDERNHVFDRRSSSATAK